MNKDEQDKQDKEEFGKEFRFGKLLDLWIVDFGMELMMGEVVGKVVWKGEISRRRLLAAESIPNWHFAGFSLEWPFLGLLLSVR